MREQLMVNALKQAIKRQTIELVYQPKYNLSTGAVIGYEALARWQDHQFGAVSPQVFIHLAEKYALIDALSDVVIKKTFQFLKVLKAQGQAVPIAINISALTLNTSHFAERFRRFLSQYNLSGDDVVIEITETAAISDWRTTCRQLEQLKVLGIQIELDDFGTGYASLKALEALPIDGVKIDRCFVASAYGDTKKRTFLEAIVSLARGLGIAVIAEGIETREDFELLKALDVAYGQGYFMSRPLAPNRIAHTLQVS